MLAKKSYSIAEMEELLRTTGKQNIDRKLQRYGIDFSSGGYGSSRTYNIKHMPNSHYQAEKHQHHLALAF